MFYLMIKEIKETGLKYLCKRKQYDDPTDHIKYKGSGVEWNRILAEHPEYTIVTTVLGLYDEDDLVKYGIYYSNLWNIVESNEWANLRPEQGDGGVSHKGTHPYVNPKTGKVVYRHSKPEGYEDYTVSREPFNIYHHPITHQMIHVPIGDTPPDGFEPGGLKGTFNYGPKKNECYVYHNGKNKIYVPKNQNPPPGYVRGVHYEGTTKGRYGCYNPETGEKLYLPNDADVPEGFIKGLPPTTGKQIITPSGKFATIEMACKSLNMTRYQILKLIKSSPEHWKILNNDTWQKGQTLNESINNLKG